MLTELTTLLSVVVFRYRCNRSARSKTPEILHLWQLFENAGQREKVNDRVCAGRESWAG
jgi:hypothetical protein